MKLYGYIFLLIIVIIILVASYNKRKNDIIETYINIFTVGRKLNDAAGHGISATGYAVKLLNEGVDVGIPVVQTGVDTAKQLINIIRYISILKQRISDCKQMGIDILGDHKDNMDKLYTLQQEILNDCGNIESKFKKGLCYGKYSLKISEIVSIFKDIITGIQDNLKNNKDKYFESETCKLQRENLLKNDYTVEETQLHAQSCDQCLNLNSLLFMKSASNKPLLKGKEVLETGAKALPEISTQVSGLASELSQTMNIIASI